MLGRHYRFTVKNSLGQTITATSAVTVMARRNKFASDGSVSYESSEATVFDHGATDIATATYYSGSTLDNTTDKYVGGDFEWSVTAPASSSGTITLYYETSTDGGTTFDTNGDGRVVAVLPFTTSGTKVRSFAL